MLTLQVHEKNIDITEKEEFIRGTVGAKVKIDFDDFWQGYKNTIVFKQHDKKPINILVNNLSNTLTIPYELLAKNIPFKIGAFGVKTDTVTPTLWSDNIKVRAGTDTNGTTPAEYTPSEIEQIKSELDNKLNKKLDIKKDLNYVYDHIKLYASINNNSNLVSANQSATENTIPVRDGNGSVNCKIAIKDSSGNNYSGSAAPHTWVNDRINELNLKYNNIIGNLPYSYQISKLQKQLKTETEQFTALTQIVNAKKITVYQVEADSCLELKTSSLYAFLKNDDSNKCSVGLADDVIGTNFKVFNSGTNDEIIMKFGIVIIPENTMGSSSEYPPSYYCVAAVDKTTLGVTTVSSKKFTVKQSDLNGGKHMVAKADSNGSFMVWELKL